MDAVSPLPAYLASLRGVHEMSFDREGVPMVLALQALASRFADATQDWARDDGARVASVVEAARAQLFPTRRDGDLGCLISTVQSAMGTAFDPTILAAASSSTPTPATSAAAGGALPGYLGHVDAYRAGRHLRVVNFHNTPVSAAPALKAELAGLQAQFAVVTAAELDEFAATGTWRDDRPGVVPVFYEGYANNAEVAAPICDELGISAWFFVCTGFVDCPPAEQEAFARSHNIELLTEDLGRERLAMTWDVVGDLAQRHTVTPHTASHEGIAEVVTDDDLEREVIEPKQKLDAATGQDSPAMAWLWGSPAGGSERHDAALRAAGYRYVFSNTMIQRLR